MTIEIMTGICIFLEDNWKNSSWVNAQNSVHGANNEAMVAVKGDITASSIG